MLLKFTQSSGAPIYVDSGHIASIEPDGLTLTRVRFVVGPDAIIKGEANEVAQFVFTCNSGDYLTTFPPTFNHDSKVDG